MDARLVGRVGSRPGRWYGITCRIVLSACQVVWPDQSEQTAVFLAAGGIPMGYGRIAARGKSDHSRSHRRTFWLWNQLHFGLYPRRPWHDRQPVEITTTNVFFYTDAILLGGSVRVADDRFFRELDACWVLGSVHRWYEHHHRQPVYPLPTCADRCCRVCVYSKTT